MKGKCSPIHSERSNTTLSAWHSIIGFVHLLDYIDAFLLLSFTEILQSTFKRKAQLSYIINGYDNNNIKIFLNIIVICYVINIFLGVPDHKERKVDLLKE